MSYLQCLSYNCVEQLCAYGVKKKGDYETDPDSLSNCPGRLPFFSTFARRASLDERASFLGLNFLMYLLKLHFSSQYSPLEG